ncbi:MAG TPA: zinc ABC transporter substrate-binding protein [Jatrophihabitans sp.]|uniref:metal ABC transporter solute-binding protein, Zn/Mn family n=1 Tax=Jatrophihabitans sp. TaxID=1932789 RepID=UPI002E0A44A1|nr:zinc ABC transporter substrate-binding protein [Jatrophihabitans sp.]
MLPIRLVAALLSAASVLAACGAAGDSAGGNGLPTSRPDPNDHRIQVLAAESLWGDLAAQIGGALVHVTSILDNPNQDPHEYQSGVGDAAAVADAQVVVVNGVDYDPFMQRLLSVDTSATRTVVTIATVVGAGNGANPHLWYDPAYVERAAVAIAAALTERQPAHAAGFARGLAAARAAVRQVVAVIRRIRVAHAGESVGYTEGVPYYLVRSAGLTLGTPIGFSRAIEDGTDPSPGDSAHFEQAITGRRIRALLLNTQVGDRETARLAGLARSHGVPVVGVGETLPPGRHLQAWQAAQAEALLAALDG